MVDFSMVLPPILKQSLEGSEDWGKPLNQDLSQTMRQTT